MRSFKYVWTLVVVCLYNEISIIYHRDQYLGRVQNGIPEFKFGISEQKGNDLKISRPMLEENHEKKTEATPAVGNTANVAVANKAEKWIWEKN